LDAQYLAPARLDDEVIATASIAKLARSYVVFQQEVRLGERVLCRANAKVACVKAAMKPTALPSYICQSVQAYLNA
jgi:acyl-CoA thioesterase FadM